MPFTLSHPLAALALRRTGLPMAAMVAGTMAPDVPLFVRLPLGGYAFSHSPAGIPTVDALVGVAGVAVWVRVLRDPLVDVAPAAVRERLPPTARYAARQWWLVAPAVVLGACTHVLWDSFTHDGRWGVRRVGWLRAQHHGWAGYHWAQAVSTVLGLALTVAWSARLLLRRPRIERPLRAGPLRGRVPWTALPVVGVALVVAVMAGAAVRRLGDGLHAAAFDAAVLGVATSAATLVAVAAIWHGTARRASDPSD